MSVTSPMAFVSGSTWMSPRRVTDRLYWIGHAPFAFWLVDVMRPRLFVELGTETGVSFCAVCQAVAQVAAPTHAVAIDTWVGDGHTGAYSESVYKDLSDYVRTNYASFAQLVRSPFDHAIDQFADGSIDLLHIDGSHIYEDVRHDFETWLPKLSRRGVVLFHDIVERQNSFGVWKFWDEVSRQYPAFSFNHSSGLGVLAVGPECDANVLALTQLDEEVALKVRMIYGAQGDRIESKAMLAAAQDHADELELNRRTMETTLRRREKDLVRQEKKAHDRDVEVHSALIARDAVIEEKDRQIQALRASVGSRKWTSLATSIARTAVRAKQVVALRRLRGQFSKSADAVHLFDAAWYLAQNSDVRSSGADPLTHYLTVGGFEGRRPHPLFDSKWYLAKYPDVAAAGVNPLVHYLNEGAKEGRHPSPVFDPHYYVEQVKSYQAPKPTQPTVVRPRAASPRKLPVGSARSRIFAYTSVALNYIPKARVLAETLKAHNPDVKFCLLVCEPVEAGVLDELTVFDEIKVIDELNLSDLKGWIFSHTLVELCTAVKGFYMQELLRRPDCAAAFYFDPDIVVLDKIDPLLRGLDQASILLTPHLTDPEETVDAIVDNELAALKHGVYNLGFLGLKPSSEGLRFAQWWADRLERFCRADIPNGMFTDQRWVDLAPGFFSDIHILRHPGCNVATWNLSRRRIEGSLAKGFRVNGEPLIFYHFSGFDSGAQEVMLNKYGQAMPAAHELRAWYIATSERPEDQTYFRRKPFYERFDDGTLITNEHRRLYRDREDLRRAFPDPFSTGDPAASYLSWYRANQQNERVPSVVGLQDGANPLVHFLTIGADLGLRPCSLFDPAYYRQSVPAGAVAGVNPLVHYETIGVFEGRNPSREFQVDYYLEQLSPGERQVCSNPLKHYYEYGQAGGIRTDPRYDPKRDMRVRQMIQDACLNGHPALLMVMHYGDGGADKHVRELLQMCSAHVNILLLNPKRDGSVKITHPKLRVSLNFEIPFHWDLLLKLLRDCGVARVHIHHLLGNEHYVSRLIGDLNVPFDYTLHDYYALSPQPHLVGPDGRFVGEDLAAAERKLLDGSMAPTPPRSLALWQSEHRWVLENATRVLAPANDIAHRYHVHGPRLNPIVAAHIDIGTVSAMTRPSLSSNEPLRIACLGVMGRHKGMSLLAGCARLAAILRDPLEFYLVGFAETPEYERVLTASGVKILGQYLNHEQLSSLLAKCDPHLLWYPGQCPESFSYTLSEGMQTGLPMAVTNLGAFPERVGARAWTWVRWWDLQPEAWLAFFRAIRAENFATDTPPAPEGVPWRVTDQFYRDEYLHWADSVDSRLSAKISERTGTY